jgi:hypothetical protein
MIKLVQEHRSHVVLLFLVLGLPVAGSCQQLDPNLATGNVNSSTGRGGSGVGGGAGAQSSCNTARMQARAILATNCSGCHQDPMKQMSINSGGPFAFILELDKLTTETSPTFIGKHYVVQGDVSNSLIHSRYQPGGGMPPGFVTQRPSPTDLGVLDDWITRCIGDPDSPGGWPAFTATDAGTPTDGGRSPFPACGPANVCPNGDCCVFSQCVPNGTACGPLVNPTAGTQDLPGLPGMCTGGSCQKSGDGGTAVSCGKVSEPCCDLGLCTASQASCLITDMTMCSQCGGTGEPCCKPNGCLDGRTCTNGGVGRVGTCQLCGELGQPCCGAGVAALQKCNGGLACVSVSGMGNLCSADGGTDDGGATGG